MGSDFYVPPLKCYISDEHFILFYMKCKKFFRGTCTTYAFWMEHGTTHNGTQSELFQYPNLNLDQGHTILHNEMFLIKRYCLFNKSVIFHVNITVQYMYIFHRDFRNADHSITRSHLLALEHFCLAFKICIFNEDKCGLHSSMVPHGTILTQAFQICNDQKDHIWKLLFCNIDKSGNVSCPSDFEPYSAKVIFSNGCRQRKDWKAVFRCFIDKVLSSIINYGWEDWGEFQRSLARRNGEDAFAIHCLCFPNRLLILTESWAKS